MKTQFKVLENTEIFKGIQENLLQEIFNIKGSKIVEYKKGDIVAIEDLLCEHVGIILEGNLEIQKLSKGGKSLTIQRLSEGGTFGEAVVFSLRNTYPATIVSSNKSKVMFISKDTIIDLCSRDKQFLGNFMLVLSEKIFNLNNKIKSMSLKSIRQKIANYILEEYYTQRNKKINLNMNKKELAESLGIPRPSLSRELINMKNEGILKLEKNYIYIIDKDALEDIMCK